MLSSTDRPLISILTPCKNAGHYLNECMDSIIKQSYTNWELIIVDDQSTDQSLEIMLQWSDRYPNIKVLINNKSGIISALRLAYSESKGNLITRMDADDIMSTNKLSTMAAQLWSIGPGNIATGKVEYFRNDQPLGNGYLKYAEWLNALSVIGGNFKDIYKECVIPSPCWMMFRADLNLIGAFQNDAYPEDYDLVLRMCRQGLNVIPCKDEILHFWRDHNSRASRNDVNYQDNRFLKLKINYFLEIDYDFNQPLVLWGAGKKAKLIAKELIEAQVKIIWITNNRNKIGHNIYGTILSSIDYLSSLDCSQIIMTVANPKEQEEIKTRLRTLEIDSSFRTYWFC